MSRSARGPAPVELAADCAACGLESGVVEVYDALVPACRFGLPASSRCRLCGEAHEGRFDRAPPRPLGDVPANACPACHAELAPSAIDERRCAACGASASLVRTADATPLADAASLGRALDDWAKREGFSSRQELLDATFCEPELPRILERLRRRERVEVVADPFSKMGARPGGSAAAARAREAEQASAARAYDPDMTIPDPSLAFTSAATDPMAPPIEASVRASVAPLPMPEAQAIAQARAREPEAPPSAPPRAILYPLVSLVAADGEIHPAERALVDAFLKGEGLAPLTDDELRVHHPSEVAHLVPKERREGVVQLMCEAASIDGMPDESERRVIRAYANAWSVPDEKVDFWMWGYESMGTGVARQLWLKIRRFVLSARWSDASKE